MKIIWIFVCAILAGLSGCAQGDLNTDEATVHSEQTSSLAVDVTFELIQRERVMVGDMLCEKLEIEMINNTDFLLDTDLFYKLEYFDGDAWTKVPALENEVIDLLDVHMEPGEQRIFTLMLYPQVIEYETGSYRICKTIEVNGLVYTLSEEFVIEGSFEK